MKLSWDFFVAAASLSGAAAAATTGHVFAFDAAAAHAVPASSPVDAATARLVLAQRLGLARFHSLQHAGADAISHINAFGGRQQQLFGAHADASRARLLVWLEDADDALVAGLRDAATRAFAIASPPSAADNDRLLDDFTAQADALPKLADPKATTYSASIDADAALSALKKTTLHSDYLTVFRASKSDSFDRALLQHALPTLAASGLDVTVVAMPSSSGNAKRRVAPYGTYDMPTAVEARRDRLNPEALLSFTPEPSTSPKADYPDLEDFPVFTSSKKANTTVRGILPPFFNSLDSCEKTTLDCSGHGKCKLLHKAQDKSQQDRYACVCSPTVLNEGKNSKTTTWAGPACQKKDITVPFWLFVGTGVALAFLISTIIGMMYSIGSEELPSVIGAGVSGPVRK